MSNETQSIKSSILTELANIKTLLSKCKEIEGAPKEYIMDLEEKASKLEARLKQSEEAHKSIIEETSEAAEVNKKVNEAMDCLTAFTISLKTLGIHSPKISECLVSMLQEVSSLRVDKGVDNETAEAGLMMHAILRETRKAKERAATYKSSDHTPQEWITYKEECMRHIGEVRKIVSNFKKGESIDPESDVANFLDLFEQEISQIEETLDIDKECDKQKAVVDKLKATGLRGVAICGGTLGAAMRHKSQAEHAGRVLGEGNVDRAIAYADMGVVTSVSNKYTDKRKLVMSKLVAKQIVTFEKVPSVEQEGPPTLREYEVTIVCEDGSEVSLPRFLAEPLVDALRSH